MVEERNLGDRIVNAFLYVVLTMVALMCALPFVHVLAVSLSDRAAVSAAAVAVWPIGFNTQNYQYLFQTNQFLHAFGISVARILVGVIVNLAVTILTAYPLARDDVTMPGRTVFKVILLAGLLFSGGLIPTYLAVSSLGLLNNFLVLILPIALNIFYVILLINFFRGIPRELVEAAEIDGASHLDVLWRIFLPVSLPSLATITLFAAVTHWNSWFDGILYLSNSDMWPLQSLLYSLVSTRQLQWATAGGAGALQFVNASPEGLTAALIFFASVPILLVYPFLQRYFVTGLTLGSVKG